MAILKVARLGHPVLRTKAQPIRPADITSASFQALIDDMFETMDEYAGIGLAAPQVHAAVRLFVAGVRKGEVGSEIADDSEMPYIAIINPEIVPVSSDVAAGWEGCLSIPDIRGKVPRATEIRLRGFDRTGKRVEFAAAGLAARVIQHEADHLDGVLFFDRMTSFDTLTFLDEFKRYWAKDDQE